MFYSREECRKIERDVGERAFRKLIGRQSGRTTATALKLISEAMLYPGKEVLIYEYDQCYPTDYLANIIDSQLRRLGLRGFQLVKKDGNNYIRYSNFGIQDPDNWRD